MKLWLVVVATSVLSVGATLSYTNWRDAAKPSSAPKKRKKVSQDIIDEQLARNIAFLGKPGVEKIRNTSIVVVGAGGVGSWASTMLVRSGFGKVKIIDFDQVTLSSLNRHACATLADVGTSKVNCLADYLERVAPWVEIEAVNSLWTKDQAHLLDGADYVVDCIDNVDTKVDLLEYCVKNKIPVISSMGASTKADPRRVEISDISNTNEDPLSRVCRIKLRQRQISKGIVTVFSSEKPSEDKAKLLDLDPNQVEQGDVDQLGVVKGFRVRTLPVLGPIPAMFGLTIATHLITWVGDYHSIYDPVLGGEGIGPRVHGKQFQNMHRKLRTQFEHKGWCIENQMPISVEDVTYLVEDVWANKSMDGVSGLVGVSVWDPQLPKDIYNVVPMTRLQLDNHNKHIINGDKAVADFYTPQQLQVVAKRRAVNEWYSKWR